ncbi:hypothetical protein QWY85_14825 [Neolewinella lacunae]|uniref:Uncharacterized protein n=1 Tax=Neolewinella lacunae TaxID=1517758 RepID=A0A923PK07_9BACT|nr:hypothetical protein [Neolewinella lacunae]MBC6993121.1 hypothetical protein [Neolewinella lacunae]MDN3635941.1 hypothetical protein [Neolewinella lacunae]
MTFSNFDPFAVWYFSSSKSNEYYKYSNRDFGCYPIWVFWNLKKVLDILYRNKILQVNRLTFLSEKRFVVETGSEIDVEMIIDIIVQKVHTERFPAIKFSGQTTLIENGQESNYFGIVDFQCDLDVGNFNITLLSDCWVPIDREDKLQIDLAEQCSPRLIKVLKEIKELGFDSIDPDCGEEYTDELLPQFGFKVFLRDSAVNEIDYNSLSIEEKKSIEKYLWKNRGECPGLNLVDDLTNS